MIRITKSAAVPALLSGQGKKLTRSLCAKHDRLRALGKLSQWRPRFDSAAYGDAAVKDALRSDQHGKCCYCEGRFEAFGFGDVEHFRPKAGYHQGTKGSRQRPGYYWLAYEWTNLLLSCEMCNRKHKRNYFPLRVPACRACSHHDSIGREDPMPVDPTAEDPAPHVTFRKEVVADLTDKGRETIRRCGLDRKPLEDLRRDYYEKVGCNDILSSFDDTSLPPHVVAAFAGKTATEIAEAIRDAKAALALAAKDNAMFAGMVRANFPSLPR